MRRILTEGSSLWIALSSSVILFNKWVLASAKFSKFGLSLVSANLN